MFMDNGRGELLEGHLQCFGVRLNMQRVKRNPAIWNTVPNLSWLGCILQVCVQRCDAGALIPGGVKVNLESLTRECCF